MKFVNPRNDVAFRKIFGSEDRAEILIAFLNAVLGLTGDKEIQSLRILNPYQTPKLETLKMTILDVKATDKRGVTFIVEMQIEHTSAIKKRFTYYTAQAYASQIERGEEYPNPFGKLRTRLNQVFFIGILDFKLFEKNDSYLSRHQTCLERSRKILDVDTCEQELKDIEFNFIELPKFQKSADEVETVLDKWVYFIKNADDLEVEPAHVEESPLQAAYQAANQFGWSKEDLEAYDYRGIRIQDARGALAYAQQQGLQQGLQQGEKNKAIGTARKMLAKGYAPAEIVDLTGLSSADLAEIDK